MDETFRAAGIQMKPLIADVAANMATCLERMEEAAQRGSRLIVFPEAALSGYVYSSLDEAYLVAEPIPGPSVARLAEHCRELDVYAVVGMLEKDGPHCYNAAVLVGPSGLVGKYRKLHLPYVGVDRFVRPGDLPLQVHDTEIGKIGLSICYDLDFPEHSRVLALAGAEVIVTVANWPEGIEFVPEYLLRTRARENMVYQLAVNRVGTERGATFFGRSKFCDCLGGTLADGKAYTEDVLYADIRPAWAREKRKVIVPGELEVDLIKDRRPEFYGPLTAGAHAP
jgi:predicted amidohydrolase